MWKGLCNNEDLSRYGQCFLYYHIPQVGSLSVVAWRTLGALHYCWHSVIWYSNLLFFKPMYRYVTCYGSHPRLKMSTFLTFYSSKFPFQVVLLIEYIHMQTVMALNSQILGLIIDWLTQLGCLVNDLYHRLMINPRQPSFTPIKAIVKLNESHTVVKIIVLRLGRGVTFASRTCWWEWRSEAIQCPTPCLSPWMCYFLCLWKFIIIKLDLIAPAEWWKYWSLLFHMHFQPAFIANFSGHNSFHVAPGSLYTLSAMYKSLVVAWILYSTLRRCTKKCNIIPNKIWLLVDTGWN